MKRPPALVFADWDSCLPAIGDCDPKTGVCKCGCGKTAAEFKARKRQEPAPKK